MFYSVLYVKRLGNLYHLRSNQSIWIEQRTWNAIWKLLHSLAVIGNFLYIFFSANSRFIFHFFTYWSNFSLLNSLFFFSFFIRLNCLVLSIYLYVHTVHTSSFAHDLFKMYRPDFPAMHNESLVEIYGKYLPNFRYRWLADIIPTHHKLLASSGMTFNNIFCIQKLRVLFNRHFIQQQTISLCVCIYYYCIDAIALDVCLCSLAGKRYAISRRKKNTFDTFKFPLQMLLQAVKEIEAPKWGRGRKKNRFKLSIGDDDDTKPFDG